MDELKSLLQVSAKLYQLLLQFPEDESREEYIEKVENLLDERKQVIKQTVSSGFQYDASNKMHVMLFDLDKGIVERLNNLQQQIKLDLKNVQNTKKHEHQYINPYSSVQVMDGRYYDKKK